VITSSLTNAKNTCGSNLGPIEKNSLVHLDVIITKKVLNSILNSLGCLSDKLDVHITFSLFTLFQNRLRGVSSLTGTLKHTCSRTVGVILTKLLSTSKQNGNSLLDKLSRLKNNFTLVGLGKNAFAFFESNM